MSIKAANFLNNLSAAYNLSVIGLVLMMTGVEEDAEDAANASVAGMVGAVVGQLVIGTLGDLIGTVRALLLTTLIVVVGAILSAALPPDSAALSSSSSSNNSRAFFTALGIARFIVGIGAGGMYPITASLTAEEEKRNAMRERMANARNVHVSGRLVRGDPGRDPDGQNSTREMLLIFSGQGVGQILAPLVVYLTSSAVASVDTSFRVTLAFGAIPSLLALGLLLRRIKKRYEEDGEDDEVVRAIVTRAGQHPDVRDAMRVNAELTASANSGLRFEDEVMDGEELIEEEEEEEEDVENGNGADLETESGARDGNSSSSSQAGGGRRRVVIRGGGCLARISRVVRFLFRGKTLRALVGTGGTWFLFDVSFYANVVFASLVLQRVFGLKRPEKENLVDGGGASFARAVAGPTALVLTIGLPGYFLTIPLAKRIGLKRLQTFGFLVLAILYGILAVTFSILPVPALFVLYAATFLFSNCGPNSTTFCLPARTFPATTRSTLNGISAAMGKAGAILGTGVFPYVFDKGGPGAALGLSCGVAFLGCLLTHTAVIDDYPGLAVIGGRGGPLSNGSTDVPTSLEMSTPFRLAGDGASSSSTSSVSASSTSSMSNNNNNNGTTSNHPTTDYDSNPFRKVVKSSAIVPT